MTDNTTQTNFDKPKSLKPNSLSEAYRMVANAARHSPSVTAFYREALQLVAAAFASPYAEIYVRLPSEIVEDYYHSGPSDPGFWKPMAQRFLNESLSENQSKLRLFNSKQTGSNVSIVLLSAPIHQTVGSAIGALLLVIYCESREQAQIYLAALESLTYLISYCAEYVGSDGKEKMLESAASGKYISRVAGYSSRHELAFALTNNLRNKSGCDQVVLGLVNRKKVKLIAISGHDEVQKRSPDVAKIREAMEECLDMNIPILYQQEKSPDKTVSTDYRLHRQWHESAGLDAVASIPLHTDAGCAAVVSLKRNSARPFTTDELQKIRELIEPYTAAFKLIDRAHRGLITHIASSLAHTVQTLIKPQGWTKKIAALCVAAFIGWFVFGSIDYQITVSGTVIPDQVRHFAAPMNAVLESAAVVQGDRVSGGDVLCTFDHSQLLMERDKLRAQLQIAQLRQADAISKRIDVDAELARADIRLIEANLNLINQKIEQSTVRSPYNGLIIAGDLRQRIGEVLPQGEPLFEIASSRGWLIELEIPERLSADFITGLDGKFSTNAKPELSHQLHIKRVSPKTELYKMRNVYLAEADVVMDPSWVKAGMEGVAKIRMGRRPVWWIALHRIIDYIHLNS